jgi:hypothetical protein
MSATYSIVFKSMTSLKIAFMGVLLLGTMQSLASPGDSLALSEQRRVSAAPGIRNNAAYAGFKDPVQAGLFKKFLNGLTTGGYYRGFFYSRNMHTPYGNVGPRKTMGVGDGYYDPVLFLYVGGNMTPSTSFGTELILANPFEVYRGPGYSTNGNINPYFTMVLRGSFNTDVGTFSVLAGGIEWARLTPFTFGANVGYNRFSIFERRPWDPVGNIKSRYAGYYYNGNIEQDTRFGTQAFKGFILNGFLKDINTNVEFFYGKTGPNGGIDRENVIRPSQNIGLRVKKNLVGGNYISANTFNSLNRSDTVNVGNDVQWNIYTTEFSFQHKGVILTGELGAGRYKSPVYPEDWSEGILLDLTLPKSLTYIPFTVRYFQIGKSFTSNVANFNNTTISEVNTGYNGIGTPLNTPFGASMMNVGDLANNRRGVELNTNFKVWKFLVGMGMNVSGDLENLPNDSTLFYNHRINNLVWSRLPGIFPIFTTYGPEQRVGSFYRGAYEVVQLHDEGTDSVSAKKNYFNAFDFQLRYKTMIFRRDLYINYLGSLNSVQDYLSLFSKMNSSAFISGSFHEMDLYYQLHPKLILALYGGYERVKGNRSTDLGPTGDPRNQYGRAMGLGFDFSISDQTSLFIRHRWFSFEDKSFPNEKFKGTEGTLELKIYF